MKERNGYWDACKFVLVALVAIGHGMAEYMDFSQSQAYLYHLSSLLQMPAFAFISGHFSKNITGDKFKKFCIATIETYLVFQLFYMLYDRVDYTFVEFLLKPLKGTWFLIGLIIWKGLTLLTNKLSYNGKMVAFVASIILSILSGFTPDILMEYGLSRIIYLFPYFFLGVLMSSETVEKIRTVKYSKLIAVLYIIGVIVMTKLYLGEFYLLIQGSVGFQEPVLKEILLRTLLIGNAIILMFCFFALMPKNPPRLIADWGSKTVIIYLYHQLVLTAVMRAVAYQGVTNGYIISLCYIFVPLLVTIGMTYFKISFILLRPISYVRDRITSMTKGTA